MRLSVLLLLALLGVSRQARAQSLVANIDQTNVGSRPASLASDGGYLTWFAEAPSGARLFYLSGDAAEAEVFTAADGLIPAGEYGGGAQVGASVYFYSFVEQTTVYYRADLGTGTLVRLGELASTGANGGIPYFTALGDRVIFLHRDANYDSQLYATDGTEGSLTFLTALPAGESVTEVKALAGHLFYGFGYRPGKTSPYVLTDGTPAGSHLRYPEGNAQAISNPTPFGNGGIVSVIGSVGSANYLLDPSDASLRLLRDTLAGLPSGTLGNFTPSGDRVLFTRVTAESAHQVWQIDTATHAVDSLFELFPENSREAILDTKAFGEQLVLLSLNFSARTYSVVAADLRTGSSAVLLDSILNIYRTDWLTHLEKLGDNYYFKARRGNEDQRLWRSAGLATATPAIEEIVSTDLFFDDDRLAVLNDRLYYTAVDATYGEEVFSLGEEDTEARLLLDANDSENGSDPVVLGSLQDALIFTAGAGCTGRELFATRGTPASSELLRDLNEGAGTTNIYSAVRVQDELVFSAESDDWFRLYATDGTTAGTRILDSAFHATNRESLRWSAPGVLEDRVLAMGYVQEVGQALYATDGVDDSLRLVKVIEPSFGLNGSVPGFFNLSDIVLFTTATAVNGQELWRTDGTAEGTYMIKDIRQVYENSVVFHINNVVVIGDLAYFTANDGGGVRMWRTDGTEAGTYMVSNPAFPYANPQAAFAYGGKTYFVAGQGAERRLFETDGTAANLRYAELLPPTTSFRSMGNFTVLRDRLLFIGNTATSGSELWVVEDATSQAVLLADLVTGPDGSFPRHLTPLNDSLLLFSASLPEVGRELWSTDGTPGGTRLVADMNPGTASADPGPFTVFGDYAYFPADAGVLGQELYRYGTVTTGEEDESGTAHLACALPSDTSTAVVELPELHVAIFPNPAVHSLRLRLERPVPVSVVLADAAGRSVLRREGDAAEYEIAVDRLPAGTYTLNVAPRAGGRAVSRRVLVVR